MTFVARAPMLTPMRPVMLVTWETSPLAQETAAARSSAIKDGAVIGVCVAGRLAPVLGRLTVIVPAVDLRSPGVTGTGETVRSETSDQLRAELGQSGQAVFADGFGREQRDHGHPVGK